MDLCAYPLWLQMISNFLMIFLVNLVLLPWANRASARSAYMTQAAIIFVGCFIGIALSKQVLLPTIKAWLSCA